MNKNWRRGRDSNSRNSRSHAFQACTLNHSVTSPQYFFLKKNTACPALTTLLAPTRQPAEVSFRHSSKDGAGQKDRLLYSERRNFTMKKSMPPGEARPAGNIVRLGFTICDEYLMDTRNDRDSLSFMFFVMTAIVVVMFLMVCCEQVRPGQAFFKGIQEHCHTKQQRSCND